MAMIKVAATYTWIMFPKKFELVKSPTDFSIGTFSVKQVLEGEIGENTTIVVKGKTIPKSRSEVGVLFNLEGEYTKDSKGRYCLDCSVAEIAKPTTEEEMIAFLGCGVIKGIGPKLAKRIWDRFHEDTIRVIEEEPEKLKEVHGISKAKAEQIAMSYQSKGSSVRDFITKLKKFDIPEEVAVKAYDVLGDERDVKIEQSIYNLVNREIMSFAAIERIAQRNPNFNPKDPIRIEKAVLTILIQSEVGGELFKNGGNLYCPYDEAVEKTLTLLANMTSEKEVNRAFRNLADADQIVIDTETNSVYRYITWKAETDAAKLVAEQLQKKVRKNSHLESELEKECKALGLKLADEQKAAVIMALEHPFSVITGFPGTGKTTIQKLILTLLEKVFKEEAMLVAPTGRAAKCMMESTGHQANTIHSALQLQGEHHMMEDIPELDKVRTDLLIADESSMTDIYLFRALLSRISAKRIVIIGDIDQLPSVGCGAVLKDLIETNLVPLTRLTRIYRQKNVNGILINAMHIRRGEYKMQLDPYFRFHELPDNEISEAVIKEYREKVDKYGLDDVILLTPYRRIGELCANVLNTKIQQMINPDIGQPSFVRNRQQDLYFRKGDPILLMKNMFDKGIVNGDVGICTDCSEDSITVNFSGKDIKFNREESKSLELSYATTVHKSQGSEYKHVLMIMSASQKGMNKRSVLYTGLTRAKVSFSLYGSRMSYGLSIKNVETYERLSHLSSKISRFWV